MSFINLLELASNNCQQALESSFKTELNMKHYYCAITEVQWLKVTDFNIIFDSDTQENNYGCFIFVKASLFKV